MDFRDILEQNKGLTFVDRILNPNRYPVIHNPDGTVSTHLMSSAQAGGQNIAYPTIIYDQAAKSLKKLSSDEALNHALKNKGFIAFDTPELAEEFASGGYKQGTFPKDHTNKPRLQDLIQNFSNQPIGPEYKIEDLNTLINEVNPELLAELERIQAFNTPYSSYGPVQQDITWGLSGLEGPERRSPGDAIESLMHETGHHYGYTHGAPGGMPPKDVMSQQDWLNLFKPPWTRYVPGLEGLPYNMGHSHRPDEVMPNIIGPGFARYLFPGQTWDTSAPVGLEPAIEEFVKVLRLRDVIRSLSNDEAIRPTDTRQ